MSRISFCTLVLFFSLQVLPLPAQIDTTYIAHFPVSTTVAIYSTYKDFRLSFSSAKTDGVLLQNSNLGIGVKIKYKKFGVSFSLPLISFNESDAQRPNTFGVSFNVFPDRYYVQGTLQYIRGFEDLTRFREPHPVFQGDSRMYYAGIAGHYILNHRQYSLRSAVQFVDRQKLSAGSWIISMPVNYQHFTTDRLQIPVVGDANFRIDHYRSIKIGLGGGFAYSWVKGYWSFNVLATGGVEFRDLAYGSPGEETRVSKFLLSPRVRCVASVVYNRPNGFVGLRTLYLPGYDTVDGLNTRVENTRVRLTFGKRF